MFIILNGNNVVNTMLLSDYIDIISLIINIVITIMLYYDYKKSHKTEKGYWGVCSHVLLL